VARWRQGQVNTKTNEAPAARMRGKFTTTFYWPLCEPLKSELMRHLVGRNRGLEGGIGFYSQFGLDCGQFNARRRTLMAQTDCKLRSDSPATEGVFNCIPMSISALEKNVEVRDFHFNF